LAIGVLFQSRAGAAPAITREQVDAIVKPAAEVAYLDRVAVGTIDASGRTFYGYGKQRPDGRTIFEIGSVTKAFTATLLADMVKRGEVTLDTPVADLLPNDVRVPSAGVVTLRHLATHTSGLPRLPDNLDLSNTINPYADYTAEMLYKGLTDDVRRHKPGQRYEYSNLGAGLLGHALARKAGRTYEQLVIERICKPLGMRDTKMTLDAADRARLAQGHDFAGVELPPWDFDALAGAGAIRSTADDILAFVAANLGLIESPNPLRDALRLTHERQAGADDERTDIGLGWHIGTRTGARWHNGQTGGYHSFVAFVPEKQVGVVVLCNTGGGMVDTIGTQLLCAMLGETVEPIQPNPKQ
jgi:CubicO group peptidase (beta-lactamase class C family)